MVVDIANVVPATDNVILWGRTTANAGSSWDNGAADYAFTVKHWAAAGSDNATGSTGDSKIQLISSLGELVGSDTNEHGVSGQVIIHAPAGTTAYTHITYQLGFTGNSGNPAYSHGFGERKAVTAVDGFQILWSSGNVESGGFRVYGKATS